MRILGSLLRLSGNPESVFGCGYLLVMASLDGTSGLVAGPLSVFSLPLPILQDVGQLLSTEPADPACAIPGIAKAGLTVVEIGITGIEDPQGVKGWRTLNWVCAYLTAAWARPSASPAFSRSWEASMALSSELSAVLACLDSVTHVPVGGCNGVGSPDVCIGSTVECARTWHA